MGTRRICLVREIPPKDRTIPQSVKITTSLPGEALDQQCLHLPCPQPLSEMPSRGKMMTRRKMRKTRKKKKKKKTSILK
jgi:hypothetical protein